MGRAFTISSALVWGLVACGGWAAAVGGESPAEQLAELQGRWIIVACRHDGRAFPPLQNARVQFYEDELTLMLPNEFIKARLTAEVVDDQQTLRCEYLLGPDKGHTRHGLYAMRQDRIYLCLGPLDGPRPKDLTCRRGSNRLLLVLQRENPHEWDLAR